MLKKRYVFLIIILFLFSISAASASDNITADVVGVADVNVDNSLNDDIINVNEFSEDVTDNQTVLGNGNNDIDSSKLSDDLLSSSSYYPSYSDYSVSVSDTTISYGSSGSISMSISPASDSYYKYDFYLKVYDSNGYQKISQEYYGTSSAYSKSYSIGAYELSSGTYTVKIVNYDDNRVMDTATLTVRSSSSYSTYPSYSDYSVSVSDTSISYGTDGSSGYITMNIIPSSTSTYKYYYYLRIYDSNDNQKISQLYSSTSSTSSKTYSVSPNQFSPGTYTVKIVNYYDNRVMDTAKLTISNSCPSYSDYSVSVSDITIASESGGSISMSISPASDSKYKYDFYLKVYDSNDKQMISEEYYSTSSAYSKTYTVSSNQLNPGYYTIKIVNFADNKVMDTAKLVVKDTSNKLSAPDVTKYYGGSERFVVKLTDNVGNPLSGKSLTINLNGEKYGRTTNGNGEASIGINLNSGKYDVTTEYGGKKVYSTVTVKDTVISNDFSKMYKNGTQYYATFVDSQGNLLKNTAVKLNINGVYYTRTTNNQGVAKMNINLNPKTYVLTAENPASGEQHTTKITVLPNIVENYDLTKYYRNNSQYRVRLLNDAGKPVGAGVNIVFNINGVFYTRSTDANGYAKMNINLGEGEYIITGEYKGLLASNKIKVLPILSANDLKMTYKDGSKFIAKLVDGQGNVYSGQTVRFNINGVFYDRVTDDYGQAKLNVNLQAGTYTITSTYNGFNIANTVIIEEPYNKDSGYIYIDIPSNANIDLPSEYRVVKNVGIYTIEVLEWRTPTIGELDIMISDSNGLVNKYNIESHVFDGTEWHGPYGGYDKAGYHKWHFSRDDRVTQVKVQLLGMHWDGTRSY